MKRSTILGEKDLDLLDDEKDEIELKAEEDLKRKKEALKSQKLANMLGLEHEVQPVIKAKPKSNAFEKIKSARNSGIGMVANTLGVRAKGFYRSQDELVSSSTDFSTESSTSIQSTQSKSYVSLKSHHVVQEKTEFTDDDDDDITMDPVNRKASKMLDFFGVKAGQKEVGVISNLSRKNDKKQIKREVNNGTFLVRIYFGNLTFTAISLNLNAGPAEAISLIFKKFNIKDRQELYVITEYQQSTGFESKLEKGDRLYERMNTWEKNEIFIFKRSVETKKLRAAQEQQIEEVQKDSNKRVAKLSNFFGIDEKSSGAKNGSRKELLELNKLLKEMNNLESISLDFNSKRSNANRHINKEGWVEKEDKKAWKTCFFSMNNGVIVLRFAASRNDALSGDDKNVITLRLDQCNLEGTPIKSNGKYIFYIHDHVYERHGFGLETLKEADDWIDSIGKAISVSEQISKNSINNSHTSISQNEDTIHQDTELNLSDFTIHRVLGRGKFAKVVLCSQKDTGNVYAMKIIQKELDEEKCLAEARILKMVKHPFIVNLICAFQNAENVYMVMEYVSGGEIFFHISNFGRFNEDRVRYYCAEITLALEHLYSKRIIYRDIKLENLLLGKDGHIKLSDFGLSKKSLEKEAKSTTIVGTLEYLSPELLLGKLVTFSVDHWAFGVVTFEMLCGYHPFYSEDRLLIHDYILNAPIEFPDHLSLDSKDFVSSLLNRDPNKRMTMGHDKENMARNHKFFQNVNWNGILAKEIPAPFLPEITDDFDVSFFDETFTQEVITAADKLGSATSINIGGKHTSIFKGK